MEKYAFDLFQADGSGQRAFGGWVVCCFISAAANFFFTSQEISFSSFFATFFGIESFYAGNFQGSVRTSVRKRQDIFGEHT